MNTNDKITLTIHEIYHLAQFCGFVIKDPPEKGDFDTEITIEPCPPSGLKDDDGMIHCKHIAYFDEYPEEGALPLGKTKLSI